MASADVNRIIPACAGNATRPGSSSSRVSDHPRVCGERTVSYASRSAAYGSSPRVRGTRRRSSGPSVRVRIIPACAGNASIRIPVSPARSDHPRVCGERFSYQASAPLLDGSSPRVRGTLPLDGSPTNSKRIIPACAGNAGSIRIPLTSPTDHPRVCGERVTRTSSDQTYDGSSPRVRGTRGHRDRWCPSGRIIPACAGNARRLLGILARIADHPRVCGERGLLVALVIVLAGSSPRVRGTRLPSLKGVQDTRIIPACAGNARGSP